MRKLLVLAFLSLLAHNTFGQYFESGNDPASLHWRQIKTKHFRLIFPTDYSVKAQYLAHLLDTSLRANQFDLNAKVGRTDIILHPYSMISNAMVAWAPRRADFYTHPPQEGSSQEWYKQLVTHELRHLVQLSKMKTGFGNWVYFASGQQGNVGIYGLTVPNWYTEGDAVIAETAMSKSGRGRQPLFEAGIRAQLLSKGMYPYDKAYFGSYRDYTPNNYELGYQLTAYNKAKFGALTWDLTLDKVARRPFLLFPFTIGLKKATGMGKNLMYKQTMFELYEKWKTEDQALATTAYTRLSPESKSFTNYYFPKILNDGTIIALRSSMDELNCFVFLKDGVEKRIITPGPMLAPLFSASDSILVWCEFEPDLRWTNRDYSVLKIFNFQTGKLTTPSRKSRYSAPVITNDSRKIAFIETLINGQQQLVVTDRVKNTIEFVYPADSLTFQMPFWHPDAHHILLTVIGQQGKSFLNIDTKSGTAELLLPFHFSEICITDVTEMEIIFNASYTGIQNIFSLDTKGNLLQLSSSAFGATGAVSDVNGNLIYTDVHADGFQIVRLDRNHVLNKPVQPDDQVAFPLAEQLSTMSIFQVDGLKGDGNDYKTEPYRKLPHLFQVHSWAPVYLNVNSADLAPGISLSSQNSLSTCTATAGYRYDLNEQTGKSNIDLTYSGWYPVVSAGFSEGLRRDQALLDSSLIDLKWRETDFHCTFSLPLNLNQNRWIRGIKPAIGYSYLHKNMLPEIPVSFRKPETQLLTYDLSFYNHTRMSLRDLYPVWGQSLRLIYRHLPFDLAQNEQGLAAVQLFFPGLMPHHGLKVLAAYQFENSTDYPFANMLTAPRGYSNIFHLGNSNLKLDYAFPIAYPDVVLPTIFYLKRVRASVFFDESFATPTLNAKSSTGCEVMTDWHFFNWPAPINLGIRMSYRFEDGLWAPEALFGIDIQSLY